MTVNYEEIRQRNIEEYRKGTRHLAYLSDLYDIRTHFIYELLQNAEDALRKRPNHAQDGSVEFRLYPDRLEFRHNGKLFDDQDVIGICGIGEGTKTGDYSQIGKFGIGFKSVYAYTLAPRIHSGAEHFEIRRFVEPHTLLSDNPQDLKPTETCIVLPFDFPTQAQSFRPLIPAEQAYKEIATALERLGSRTLLFLRFTEEICWSNENGKKGAFLRETRGIEDYADARYVDITDGDMTETWIVFSRETEVTDDAKSYRVVVEVGFLVNDGKVVCARNTELVVSFPTAKTTELGFLIQGPFKTTKARDNIAQDSEANGQMIEAAAQLAADSLEGLRDLGLLNVASFNALPLTSSTFDEKGRQFFKPVYEAIRKALRTKPLFPRHGGGFVAADQARLARGAQLAELFSPKQLGDLFGSQEFYWLDTGITVARTPSLPDYLAGKRKPHYYSLWDQEPLAPGIETEPKNLAPKLTADFFSKQSEEWLVLFYAYLTDNFGAFKDTPFIRLASGSHVSPGLADKPNAYLPSATSGDSLQTEFPQVMPQLASNPVVLKFLRDTAKLREPNRVDVILRCILPDYGSERGRIDPKGERYTSDLKELSSAYQKASADDRERLLATLKQTAFVACTPAANPSGALSWVSPGDNTLYRRSTELEHWFAGNTSDSAWFPLSVVDECSDREFLSQLGYGSGSLIKRGPPSKSFYRSPWHIRPQGGFDQDADIYGLGWVVSNPTREAVLHLWKLLLENPSLIKGKWLRSRRAEFPTDRTESKEGYSRLGEEVTNHEWLPKEGEDVYFRPSDLSLADLPDVFEKDTPRAEAVSRALEMRQPLDLRPVAQALGMSEEQLERRRNLTDEEVEEALTRRAETQDFPERRSTSPERRRERVKERAREAPRKTSSERMRVEQDGYAQDKTAAKEYLSGQYQTDGFLFCQLDHKAMPFKLIDRDEWHFEAVECVPDARSRYRENFLALSPHYAALFQYANHDRDRMRDLILSATTQSVEVRLAEGTYSIRFTSQHLEDLKAVLEVDAEQREDDGQ